jgi:CheY-like chemotaxis protein
MQRVLIVDDHQEIRLIYSHLLRNAGYQVECAINGKEALDAINRTSPDLILLDVFMPVMNGAEFLEHLKQHPTLSALPVLLFSAVSESPEVTYAIKLGVSKFVRKGDFGLNELLTLVQQTLIENRAHSQLLSGNISNSHLH